MVHTRAYQMSPMERRLYFRWIESRTEKPRNKSIRAMVVDGALDDLIPIAHISILARPLRSNDRKKLGSSHPLLVWGAPSSVRDELYQGDVIKVRVCRSVFLGESEIYHNCVYQRTLRMHGWEPSTRINLNPRNAAYRMSLSLS